MMIKYKDANRNYWKINAEKLGRGETNTDGYYETDWKTEISFSSDEYLYVIVHSAILSTQYDEPLNLSEIFKDWVFNVNCVVIGILENNKGINL